MPPSKLPVAVEPPSFAPYLKGMLDFSLHPDMTQRKSCATLEPEDTPLTFYDRHISSNLICKQVSALSSLVQSLSKLCDDAHREGHAFSQMEYRKLHDLPPEPLEYGKAHTIGDYYESPDAKTWDSALGENAQLVRTRAIPHATIKQICDLHQRFPTAALWHFYPMTPSGKYILKDMHPQNPFHWESSRATGYWNVSSKTPPSDASQGILNRHKDSVKGGVPFSGKQNRKRPLGIRDPDTTPLDCKLKQKRLSVVNINRQPARTGRRRTDVHQFIQHAWSRAVTFDSTFIVFNCGLYERIGIRHRASQTLFLSPLIEPINSRHPSYGKLHVGLHVTIIQDLLDRSEHDLPKKRQKAEAPPPPDNVSYVKVKEEMRKRELALGTLNYGIYCSPIPATFFRLKPSCAPEYMDLTLSEPIGEGAVGVARAATVSLALETGEVLEHRVIIKLAFSNVQKEKIRHEYGVYEHLANVGHVQGIVQVHDLFEDPDSRTLALIMEDGGQSLANLNKLEGSGKNKVTGADRRTCLKALKSLHKAGVRHRDIRPANILFDAHRRVSIIDFDCATFDPLDMEQENLDDEICRMKEVLDGNYVDGLWVS
ncbi:hypothetical protein D9613_010624 [Agrocybe pediades]|uniref:Protein kinase domain-containing protein n=1 Tax=Agrocybe pediades TaxID=84607 RepID=A0A8H4QG69_9AGAR|nr:hypothetical protein D9613_010624 [Agrocybe pediades]